MNGDGQVKRELSRGFYTLGPSEFIDYELQAEKKAM